MTSLAWHLVVLVLTVVGFALTLVSLGGAVGGARREVRTAQARLARYQELDVEQAAERERRAEEGRTDAEAHAEWDRRYATEGLIRMTWGNVNYFPFYETNRLLQTLLDSSRSNLIWAGIGLLLSTVASGWSLYL